MALMLLALLCWYHSYYTDIEMVRKILFITVETFATQIFLSCDKDGNIH